MLVKLFATKVNSYEDENELYLKIDKILLEENAKLRNIYWFRGYQGLWVELRSLSDTRFSKTTLI